MAKGAAYNAYDRRHQAVCLEGTRVDVLRGILTWANERDGRSVYWLSGRAGTGKSTIARTVARCFADNKQLAASFFFTRGGGDLAGVRWFVSTIAAQMCEAVPGLRKYIAAAVRDTRAVESLSPREQWSRLVLEPLKKYGGGIGGLGSGSRLSSILGLKRTLRKPLVVVVDALDECDVESDLGALLGLLTTGATSRLPWLRVFLTSRPETPIRFRIEQLPINSRQHLALHCIDASAVNGDLFTYFAAHLHQVGKLYLGNSHWPGEETLRHLVEQAAGLFIWADTACQFIREGKALSHRRLREVIDGRAGSDKVSEKSLDHIYTTVLAKAVGDNYDNDEQQEVCSLIRLTLGTIAILQAPLDQLSLAKVTSTPPANVNGALEGLHSILDIPESPSQPIKLHHASFRDYLLNPVRCTDRRFLVDAKQLHKHIFQNCLRVMSQSLRRDICDLQAPGAQVEYMSRSLIDQ